MTTELLAPETDEVGEVPPDLAANMHHVGSVCVLRLDGSLHTGSLSAVQCQFDRLGRTPCGCVVLDLSAVSDIDPAGARLLTGLFHYVVGRGGRLRVVGWRPDLSLALADTALRAAYART